MSDWPGSVLAAFGVATACSLVVVLGVAWPTVLSLHIFLMAVEGEHLLVCLFYFYMLICCMHILFG